MASGINAHDTGVLCVQVHCRFVRPKGVHSAFDCRYRPKPHLCGNFMWCTMLLQCQIEQHRDCAASQYSVSNDLRRCLQTGDCIHEPKDCNDNDACTVRQLHPTLPAKRLSQADKHPCRCHACRCGLLHMMLDSWPQRYNMPFCFQAYLSNVSRRCV